MSAFDKIVGYEVIKESWLNYADCLKNPEKYRKIGTKLPRGVLLVGNPGLGKTLMANCFIEECGRPSYVIRKNLAEEEFINGMRDVFQKASEQTPSVILLDDMDKFANEDDDHKNAKEYVAVQALMDEYSNCDIFVIATVNETDNLPDSLLRPGRFDCVMNVFAPNKKDANKIIHYYLDRQKLSNDIDMELVLRLANGKTCAELENIINEAGLYTGHKGKEIVDQEALVYAFLKNLYRSAGIISEKTTENDLTDMHETAIHEVGHALIAEILSPESVNLVSILKNDYSEVRGVTDRLIESRSLNRWQRECEILIKLGGQAAAEVYLGEIDMGSSMDYRIARFQIETIIENTCEHGICGKYYMDFEWGKSYKERIVRYEMERHYRLAKRIISKNREFFDALVKELELKHIVTFRDISVIKEKVKIYCGESSYNDDLAYHPAVGFVI